MSSVILTGADREGEGDAVSTAVPSTAEEEAIEDVSGLLRKKQKNKTSAP